MAGSIIKMGKMCKMGRWFKRNLDQGNPLNQRPIIHIFLLIGRLPAIASAATTASKTTAGSASSARTLFLGLINLNGFAVKVRSIHLGYRRFGILILSEGNESKASGAPRIAVGDDLGFGDFSIRRERLAQTVVRRVPAQPSYK
jgi:hypothetical protein